MKAVLAVVVGSLLASSGSDGQVTAGQASGTSQVTRTEIADPMQIDISLGADTDIKGQPRPPFNEQPLGKARAYPETNNFVCDQARVRMLTVKKVAESADEVVIEAAPMLISEWPMQDVDLTVALLSADGRLIGSQQWDNLTLGAWSRSYTPPKATFRVPPAEWGALFTDGAAPTLRLVVDIQE
jgi:hypothetical protein